MANRGRTAKTVSECKEAFRQARELGCFPDSIQLMVSNDSRCTVVNLDGPSGLEPVKGLDNVSGNSFCDAMTAYRVLTELSQ